MHFYQIPDRSLIEEQIPIKEISELALREGNSKKPVYMLHKWWARRLSSVVRAMLLGSFLPSTTMPKDFWEAFYSKNSTDMVVMDVFMGGGTTIVEAKKMEAKTIGIDIDPVACFITKKEIESLNIDLYMRKFEQIYNAVANAVSKYYITYVNGEYYPIINYFWVYTVVCKECGEKLFSHPHYYLAYDKKKIHVFCKCCGEYQILPKNRKRFKCEKCGATTNIFKGTFSIGKCHCPKCKFDTELASRVDGINNLQLFALEYNDNGIKKFKIADYWDLELYMDAVKQYNKINPDSLLPQDEISSQNRIDARPMSHGYYKYIDLFNYRQRLTLGLILKNIEQEKDVVIKEWLLLAFSDCLASNNMLCCYAYGYKKLTPLFGLHAYSVPARPVENNVLGTAGMGRGTFKNCVQKVVKGKKYCVQPFERSIEDLSNKRSSSIFTNEKIISNPTNDSEEFYSSAEYDALFYNGTSEDLHMVKEQSIDLILTDPPYFDNINYSELSDFYFRWLRPFIEYNGIDIKKDSIYANRLIENSNELFVEKLSRVFTQCYQKLKDRGLLVFTYHHNKLDAWIALASSLKNASFIVTNVFPVRSEGISAYHSSDESIKWDSVIVARKQTAIKFESKNDNIYAVWSAQIRNNFAMKNCDVLSFFRSIRLMEYTKLAQITDVNEFMGQANNYFEIYWDHK